MRPGHTPFLSLLAPGPLTVREGSTTRAWFVAGGFFEVQNDTVLILADQAEAATSIDLEAATQTLREAEQKLAAMSPADPGLRNRDGACPSGAGAGAGRTGRRVLTPWLGRAPSYSTVSTRAGRHASVAGSPSTG